MTCVILVGAMLLVGVVDANGKGRMMASVAWENLPDFWRDRGGLWTWRNLVLVPLALGLIAAAWWWRGPIPAGCLFLLLASGCESVAYWWLLPVFRIQQAAYWDVRRIRTFPETSPEMLRFGVVTDEGEVIPAGRLKRGSPGTLIAMRAVGWLEYPPDAPWLCSLPVFVPFWATGQAITRTAVYVMAGLSVAITAFLVSL